MTFVVLKDAMQSAGIQRKGISDLTQNLTLVAMLLTYQARCSHWSNSGTVSHSFHWNYSLIQRREFMTDAKIMTEI